MRQTVILLIIFYTHRHHRGPINWLHNVYNCPSFESKELGLSYVPISPMYDIKYEWLLYLEDEFAI